MIKFWNFAHNSAAGYAELFLYGELCSDEPWYTDDYVAYRQFIQELKDTEGDELHLRINSPGGDVMAANAIFNQLKECGKTIIAHIDGMCASAATIPLMAADKIIASCNAMIMIHDPMVCLAGYYNRAELEKMAEVCDRIKEGIVATYRSRIHDVTEEEFNLLMTEERWMGADEAQDIGLVDEVAYSDFADVKDSGKYLVVNAVRVKKDYFNSLPVNSRNGVNIKPGRFADTGRPEKEGGNKNMDEEIRSLEDMERTYPDFCRALAERAVQGERSRLKSLDEISSQIPEKMLAEAKYGDEPVDAKELAFRALVAEQKAGEEFFGKMKKDVRDSGADGVEASPESGGVERDGGQSCGTGGMVPEEKVSDLTAALNNDKRRKKA